MEEINNECSAAGPGVFDSQQASTLVSDIEVSPCRFALPAREGQRELLAFVPSL
jgi:hypothetical protein